MEFLTWLQEQCYQTFIEDDRWRIYFLKGLGTTFKITIGALILGVIIGIIIAVVRSAYDSQRRHWHGVGGILLGLGNLLCKLYLTVIRGTPSTVQLLIMYFIIFGSSQNMMAAAIISFGVNSGAYVAEIVRSGIMSIPKGQMEAGRSLGLNYATTMRCIIIPQAIKNILPALCNEFVSIIKETSLAFHLLCRRPDDHLPDDQRRHLPVHRAADHRRHHLLCSDLHPVEGHRRTGKETEDK